MRYYNGLANSVFDFLLAPLAFESPWPGLIVVSLAAAAGLLLIFKLSSNQERIRRKKKVVFARVMELLLFRHDLGVSLIDNGLQVIIGSDEWNKKIPILDKVITEIIARSEKVKALDLRFDEAVVVKK